MKEQDHKEARLRIIAWALSRLCGESPPGSAVREWVDGESLALQDWASYRVPSYVTGIGACEAAAHLAECTVENDTRQLLGALTFAEPLKP